MLDTGLPCIDAPSCRASASPICRSLLTPFPALSIGVVGMPLFEHCCLSVEWDTVLQALMASNHPIRRKGNDVQIAIWGYARTRATFATRHWISSFAMSDIRQRVIRGGCVLYGGFWRSHASVAEKLCL